jgi:hypothetical protein
VSENIAISVDVLDSYVAAGGRDVIMPTVACIGSAITELEGVKHIWSNGIIINAMEMICQVQLWDLWNNSLSKSLFTTLSFSWYLDIFIDTVHKHLVPDLVS